MRKITEIRLGSKPLLFASAREAGSGMLSRIAGTLTPQPSPSCCPPLCVGRDADVGDITKYPDGIHPSQANRNNMEALYL